MRIHHVAFRTANLPRLERFYVDVMGFVEQRRQETRSLWLDAGGTILMLERQEAFEPAIDAASKELVCFAVRPEEGPVFERRLAEAGVSIEGRTPSTLYFRDPDGRRIGVTAYPAELG